MAKSQDDRITYARAEGTSDASGNPSAFAFSSDCLQDESHLALQKLLADRGFEDAFAPSTVYILQHVSAEHLRPYLSHVQKNTQTLPKLVKCAHDVLVFDRRFESVLLKYIGSIELQMKAQYSHWAEQDRGAMFLYEESNFYDADNYRRAFADYEREAKRKIRKDKRLRELYQGNGKRLPVDAAVECMTLGTLSRLFDNTRSHTVTEAVSHSFGASKAELSSWIKSISNARNICAHFDSLITRTQIPSPPLSMREIDANSTAPFYLAPLTVRLLARDELFEDMNLCYPYTFSVELFKLFDSFEQYLPGSLATFGIPTNWIDLLNKASGNQIYKAIELLEELDEGMLTREGLA